MPEDYYNILGVAKNCTDDDLKKAYKKLAMKHHPDRHASKGEAALKKATEQFQKVSEAYEVLSDPNKRTIYDTYGHEGLKAGPPPPGASGSGGGFSGGNFSGGGGMPGGFSGFSGGFTPSNAEDIFAQFFGGRGGGFSFSSAGFGGDDDDDSGGIPMMFGGMGGGGRGGGGGGGGGGGARRRQKKDPTIVRELAVSLEDLYSGLTKRVKITRNIVSANGSQTTAEKVLEIPIKAGMKAGTKITFPCEGDERPGAEPADLQFVIAEKPHERFTRQGDDLHITVPISLKTALCGGETVLTTLSGQAVTIPHTKVVTPSSKNRINGEGMPNSKTGERGNILVSYDIQFPRQLSPEQKAALRNLL